MSNYYATPPAPDTDLFAEEQRAPVYGTFGQRLVALIIDTIVLSILNYVIQVVLDSNLGTRIGAVVTNCLYYALMESSEKGATLGKMAMGLQVIDVHGGRITFLQGVGRYFGKILSTLIILIGYFMMLWDDRGQTLHDKMADTLVVKADRSNDIL